MPNPQTMGNDSYFWLYDDDDADEDGDGDGDDDDDNDDVFAMRKYRNFPSHEKKMVKLKT